jgi:hypothetical protein
MITQPPGQVMIQVIAVETPSIDKCIACKARKPFSRFQRLDKDGDIILLSSGRGMLVYFVDVV